MNKLISLVVCLTLLASQAHAQESETIDSKKKFKLVKISPLYILNDIELADSASFSLIDIDEIEKIEVLNGVQGEKLFGKKGANGVVIATTKSKTKVVDSPIAFGLVQSDPLFILDNIEIPRNELEKLKPEDIEAVQVIKEKTALEPYGEKGKNGVVIIKTKSFIRHRSFQN